jgi:hypothetical protein
LFVGGNSAGFGQMEGGILFRRWGGAIELGTNFSGKSYIGGKVGIKF